jgi:hypothetical protein
MDVAGVVSWQPKHRDPRDIAGSKPEMRVNES